MTSTAYAFTGAPSIDDQLAALTAACDPFTTRSLTQIGIQPGWQVLDIGAGSGTIAAWLADRVGADGVVTATDLDPSRIPDHRQITAVPHDITRDQLPEDYYDLIHARLVLLHLPGRDQIVANLARSLKPGGILVLHEFDCTFQRPVFGAAPDDVALFQQVAAGINRILATAGARLDWGLTAQTAMADAGLTDVGTHAHAETFAGGSAWARLGAINTVQLHQQLLTVGLTAVQLERFRELMADPQFIAMSYLMTRTVGRRPA